MKFAIIQSCDYWMFPPDGVNPYHICNTEKQALETAKTWFAHAPYKIEKVRDCEIPKKVVQK